jgi:uncharacterized protein (DUF736 family)
MPTLVPCPNPTAFSPTCEPVRSAWGPLTLFERWFSNRPKNTIRGDAHEAIGDVRGSPLIRFIFGGRSERHRGARHLSRETHIAVWNWERTRQGSRLPIFAGQGVEFGAAWKMTSSAGREYLLVKLDDSSFPVPVFASLVAVEGGDDYGSSPSGPARAFAPGWR